jgi:hypothetical protein
MVGGTHGLTGVKVCRVDLFYNRKYKSDLSDIRGGPPTPSRHIGHVRYNISYRTCRTFPLIWGNRVNSGKYRR